MKKDPKPNKNLGQHFLSNKGIVTKIADHVASRGLSKGEWLVEVGPGPGALTEELLKRGYKVLAIELDTRMVEHLNEKFADFVKIGQLKILHKDVLKFEKQDLNIETHSVCGNLPYNIGVDIVFKFLNEGRNFNHFTFMLQKEVVDRLVSEHGNRTYGAASIRFQWLVNIQSTFVVKPGSFTPPPKVDSAVVTFDRKEELDEKFYSKSLRLLLDQIFQKRRKMLRSILPELKDSPLGTLRPEQLSPEEFKKLVWGPLVKRL